MIAIELACIAIVALYVVVRLALTADLWLSQGSHVFGLNANVGGFNLNWFKIESTSSGPVGSPNEGQASLLGYDLITEDGKIIRSPDPTSFERNGLRLVRIWKSNH